MVHLVDASSAHIEEHIASVHAILEELNLSGIPRLLVFNKSDLLSMEGLENMKRGSDAILISALDRKSLLPMVERLSEMLEEAGNLQPLSPHRDQEFIAPARVIS